MSVLNKGKLAGLSVSELDFSGQWREPPGWYCSIQSVLLSLASAKGFKLVPELYRSGFNGRTEKVYTY
jgi:hypothetical protein